MTIERIADEIIIRLPANVDVTGLQDFVNYLTYKEATANLQATPADVDALVKEVKKDGGRKQKSPY